MTITPRHYQIEAVDAVFDYWNGLDITKLPSNCVEAKQNGVRYFYTGKMCINGHLAPKYTAGGRCVVCTQESARLQRSGAKPGNVGAARAHIARAIARLDGEKTYIPDRPCLNGHSIRWTGTNNCIECENERKPLYKAKRRETRLQKKYGISEADYDTIAKRQSNACAVCYSPISNKRHFHVDHDHVTGNVRGILCSKCNQGIGLLLDDPIVILSAARYVENART